MHGGARSGAWNRVGNNCGHIVERLVMARIEKFQDEKRTRGKSEAGGGNWETYMATISHHVPCHCNQDILWLFKIVFILYYNFAKFHQSHTQLLG